VPTLLHALVQDAWREQETSAELSLRRVRASDLSEIAAVLSRGEGYTLPDGKTSFDLEQVREGLAGFSDNQGRLGFVACEATSGALAGFVLIVMRNSLTDTYPAGDILARLPASAVASDGRFLQVYDLWVSPQWRRRGVATALKRVMEAQARALGVRRLLTFTEASHAAVLRLNEKLGYRPVYRGPMWDDVERVALIKELN
jgi:ribosomal protein S18 acetylase RimI-like enzyme